MPKQSTSDSLPLLKNYQFYPLIGIDINHLIGTAGT
tara:strand:- start:3482 stop:3589 length:108 start_codon:yes stop_codon:yes gene_type:complete